MSKFKSEYQLQRAHQMRVAMAGGGTITRDPSGRTELTYASAPYGEHALCAFASAKATVMLRKLRRGWK